MSYKIIKMDKIFIFGGAGSLGKKLIEKYINNNMIINFSRDENKHWSLELNYQNTFKNNIKNIIGNISDKNRVEEVLLRENPNIIIIAAAMKHIDKCEYAIHESLNTNVLGVKNILDCVEKNIDKLPLLNTVVFISSDKACNPMNVYGMCKAISEKLILEKAYHMDNKNIKFLTVRYGNVLNSSGSIIQILHNKGKNKDVKEFLLYHKNATRFIMTLDESCDLIDYAIKYGTNGDIIIPKLKSMLIYDLINIFSKLYNKPIKITELRPGEKINECLINEMQYMNTIKIDKYYIINKKYINTYNHQNYNSDQNNLTENELYTYLKKLELI